MRAFWLVSVFLVALTNSALAQTPVSGMDDLPPLHLTPVEGPNFTNGITVSQPLQESLPEPLPVPVRTTSILITPSGPVPKSWYTGELLLLWPQNQRLPGQMSSKSEHPIITGGRFVVGWSLGQTQQTGMEVSYLFAGSWTSRSGISPPQAFYYSNYDIAAGGYGPNSIDRFETSTRSRLQSWGVTGVANLFAGDNLRVHALVGYRNFLLNESVHDEQSSTFQGIDTRYQSYTATQWDLNTRFHGGELGLRTELTRGPFTLQYETKVALGRSYKSIRYREQTVSYYQTFYDTRLQSDPYNPERITQSHFAVLPEGGVKLGYQLGARARVSIGYTVIFLTEAVKSRDEDLASMSQSYFSMRSDYLIQGLTMGLEWHY